MPRLPTQRNGAPVGDGVKRPADPADGLARPVDYAARYGAGADRVLVLGGGGIFFIAWQVGYLMGGSILVETVFSWPGTGFLLNTAIFQRDLPLLQGTILVLCMFFVTLNLVVDILQPLIDPRMVRA